MLFTDSASRWDTERGGAFPRFYWISNLSISSPNKIFMFVVSFVDIAPLILILPFLVCSLRWSTSTSDPEQAPQHHRTKSI